jgi:predicted PurR-regulated permease PerM
MTVSRQDDARQRADTPRRNAMIALAVVAIAAFIVLALGNVIDVLLLFFISVLIALFLRTLSNWLGERTPLSPKVALALVVIGIIALLVTGVLLLAPSFAEQLQQLLNQIPDTIEQIERMVGRSDAAQQILDQTPPLAEILPSPSNFINELTAFFSSTIDALATVLIVVFVGIYLAIEPDVYVNGFLQLIPSARRERIHDTLKQMAHTLRAWLLSRGVAMLVIGTFATIGLSIIGIPLALALGVIAGLFELIPNIGPILGTIPAVLVALPMGTETTLYVLLLYFIMQQIETYFITPLVERRAVRLPPALTVAMQVLLGVMIGPLGVVLAAPLTAIGIVAVKMLYVEDVLHETIEMNEDNHS